ncbi:MAG: LPS assembly protein LptD [Deltaproteobacteria bacterium]|nr:LPS assembly protein LptD [Deltaproteobacteria bacterium]MBT6431780.1 LPS assembly protein LptD [Deltaproteobacteria bacterium]MBT6490359.1 LPS assembly protein LptD [Deltaproteobacteria bacterium]
MTMPRRWLQVRSLLLGAWLCLPGQAWSSGLQPTAVLEEATPSIADLLGQPSGLELSMDWAFFDTLNKLPLVHEGTQPKVVAGLWRSMAGIDSNEFSASNELLQLTVQGEADDGRVPSLELLVPQHLEAVEVDATLRLEMKRLDFSGRDYADASGTRYDTEFKMGRHWVEGSWSSHPVLRLNYTRYDFRDSRESMERSIPVLEWDNVWKLEKAWGAGLKQLLEPRIYYVFVPSVQQDNLPNDDSQVMGFGYDSLFQSNRLTGRDRIGDANQASLGFSTSLVSGDGKREYLKAGIAQTIYFSTHESLIGESSGMSQRGVSDLASVIQAQIGDTSIVSVMQWDPVNEELAAARAELSQEFGRQVLSLIHQKNGEMRSTELAWDYQISSQWAVTSRLAYTEGERPGEQLETALHYSGCGWAFKMDTRSRWREQFEREDYSMNILVVLDSLAEPMVRTCR